MALGQTVQRLITVRSGVLGGLKLRLVDFTGDATYAVGGYVPTVAGCSLDTQIVAVIPMGFSNTGTYAGAWNMTTGKFLYCRTGAAVASAFAEAGNNEAGVNNTKISCLVIGF